MTSGPTIPVLLISDRPDRSGEMARGLSRLRACRTIGLHGHNAVWPVAAVVIDVSWRRPDDVKRLHAMLSLPRSAAVPIVAILRDNSPAERLQAAAAGATTLFPAGVSSADIAAALAPAIGSASPSAPLRAAMLTPRESVERSRVQFGVLFDAAARGAGVSPAGVESASASIMTAVADQGIRQWLEIVWTYDDATYQHCLLVAGLAAEFAASLRFASNDRKFVIRGAVLHDLGKAKIPLHILNKPGALTSDELEIMRAHPRTGYDILHDQGDYEPELLDVVLRHHELLDGSGYPDGVVGTQISDLVRLVTICDIYAALIEHRAYKPPTQPALAFKTLQQMEGKLEGALVQAFAQVADESAKADAISTAAV
jgi:putative nucleotidyltransferase with HDIG domain